MPYKIATWDIEKIPYHKTILETARKLRKCYVWLVLAPVLVLASIVFAKCGCKVASMVLQAVAMTIALIVGIYWAAAVGKAKCCNCNGGVLIHSVNFRKVLDGYLPLCRNCRKALGVDFIKPQDNRSNTLPQTEATK